MYTLPSSGNQIPNIDLWTKKDSQFATGSTDPAVAVTEHSLNGNFTKLRNFVNDLRVLFDAQINTIPDASDTLSGKVNLDTQLFAGLKIFTNSIKIGKAGVSSGIAMFHNTANNFFAALLAYPLTATRELNLPDKDGTLATMDDVAAKQDALTSTSNVEVNTIAADTSMSIKNGAHVATISNIGSVNTTFSLPDKSGTIALVAEAPSAPLKLRVADINPITPKVTDAFLVGKIPLAVSGGIATPECAVKFAWGVDDSTGVGGNNQFVINNTVDTLHTFAANELTGYWLYIAQLSRDCKIVSNQATSSGTTIVALDGVDLTGIVITGTDTAAVIHSDATSYDVVAIPFEAGNIKSDFSAMESKSIMRGSSPVKSSATFRLYLGQTYSIEVRANNKDTSSAWAAMGAGSFTKYGGAVSYDVKFLVQLPDITDDGAIGAATTPYGFSLSITGWSQASDFEICYSANAAGADFSNPSHSKIITSERQINIAANTIHSISIKVRPLISGQQVAPAKEVRVSTGAGGVPPNDILLAQIPVNLITYSGTMTISGMMVVMTNNIKSPSGSSIVSKFKEGLVGNVLTDSTGTDFLITDVTDDAYPLITLENLLGNAFTPTAGTFTIGVSERARMLYKTNFATDYLITSVIFDVDVKHGASGVLIWYQDTNKASFDSLIINASDTLFRKVTDTTVSSNNDPSANRIFIVAYFDGGGTPNNTGGVTGTISIYGKAIVIES